jgi:hypothetical protein
MDAISLTGTCCDKLGEAAVPTPDEASAEAAAADAGRIGTWQKFYAAAAAGSTTPQLLAATHCCPVYRQDKGETTCEERHGMDAMYADLLLPRYR